MWQLESGSVIFCASPDYCLECTIFYNVHMHIYSRRCVFFFTAVAVWPGTRPCYFYNHIVESNPEVYETSHDLHWHKTLSLNIIHEVIHQCFFFQNIAASAN